MHNSPHYMQSRSLERSLLPFIACQGAFSTLAGFGAVLVFDQGGMSGSLSYTASMLTVAMLGITVPMALGRRLQWRTARIVQTAFGLPALLLWFAEGRPLVLALAMGGFLGLSWGARHWLELSLLRNEQRDSYATHVTVVTVLASLLATAVVATLLTWMAESPQAVYRSYAVMGLLGAWWAGRQLPHTPAMGLQSPWRVMRQPGFAACLPLYFLESGLLGMGMVLGASGAVQSLGQTSHYGWVASAATVAGAIALFALRRHRHESNRVRWMGLAAAGMALSHGLLGASVGWSGSYVLHLLLLAAVQPFWLASEQVLNQRVLDIQGSLADRIVVREGILWLFRMMGLAGFWTLVQDWPVEHMLMLGAALMASATLLEWALGRLWLMSSYAPEGSVSSR
ncbi:MAG: hypothetical protein RLZZ591_669 [Pseudomonadota bacterium]|jgi:hypothetical protein